MEVPKVSSIYVWLRRTLVLLEVLLKVQQTLSMHHLRRSTSGLAANLPFGLAAGMGLWIRLALVVQGPLRSECFVDIGTIARNSYLRYGIIDRLGLGPEGALAACFVQARVRNDHCIP